MEKWTITVEDRGGHDGAATGGHYGRWARVWASRPGIVTARVVKEEHRYQPGRPAYHHDLVVVEVGLTPSFDEQNDFLLVEHKASPNPWVGGSSHYEYYELLAGRMPGWADFPRAWAEWVREMHLEAARFLAERFPDAVNYALRKSSKSRIIAAWRDVAEAAGVEPPPASSWTSVNAMPIRIARKLGWRAPVPPPRWEDPETAARVLVAGPRGVREEAVAA